MSDIFELTGTIRIEGADAAKAAIKGTADAVGDATGKMSDDSKQMASDFDTNTAQVNADFDQLEKNINDSCDKASVSFTKMNRAFRTAGTDMVVVGAAIVGAFTAIATFSMNDSDAIAKMSASDQEKMAGLKQSWTDMKTAANDLKMTIGVALAPVFEGLYKILSAIITPIKEFVDHNRTLVTILAAILIPLGLIIGGIGTLMLIGIKWVQFINAWKIAQIQLNIAMDANPIGLIILAIAALIVVVVLIITHFNTLKKWFTDGWDVIVGVFKKVWDFVKDIFVGTWHAISAVFATVINGILSGVENMVNFFIKGINFIIDALDKLHYTAPSWLGGWSIGIDIPKIPEVTLPRVNVPAMAGGGVIYEPSLVTSLRTGQPVATVAENGPEAVGGAGGSTFIFNFPDGFLIGTLDEVATKLGPAMAQVLDSLTSRKTRYA